MKATMPRVTVESLTRALERAGQDNARLRARAEKAEAKVKELMAWIDGYPCACDRPRTTSATTTEKT
jgi:hypothetical protein